MKILFSPSESKTTCCDQDSFSTSSFIFPELYDERIFVLEKYSAFLKNANSAELSTLFGTNKENLIQQYRKDIFSSRTCKAVKRYNGVAFAALQYENLDEKSKDYIDENVMIFSNLFGPIMAKNPIPNYKLKQGQTIAGFAPENHYLVNFKDRLERYFADENVLDLRAKFYEKFYQIKNPYLTMKFQKNKKVVSHFAKHYRGKILRQIAQNYLTTIDSVLAQNYENLEIADIKTIKNKTEITYEILDI